MGGTLKSFSRDTNIEGVNNAGRSEGRVRRWKWIQIWEIKTKLGGGIGIQTQKSFQIRWCLMLDALWFPALPRSIWFLVFSVLTALTLRDIVDLVAEYRSRPVDVATTLRWDEAFFVRDFHNFFSAMKMQLTSHPSQSATTTGSSLNNNLSLACLVGFICCKEKSKSMTSMIWSDHQGELSTIEAVPGQLLQNRLTSLWTSYRGIAANITRGNHFASISFHLFIFRFIDIWHVCTIVQYRCNQSVTMYTIPIPIHHNTHCTGAAPFHSWSLWCSTT